LLCVFALIVREAVTASGETLRGMGGVAILLRLKLWGTSGNLSRSLTLTLG
jgi:hypothetical protein